MPAEQDLSANQRPSDAPRQQPQWLADRLSGLADRAGLAGLFDALGEALSPLAPLADSLWLLAGPTLGLLEDPRVAPSDDCRRPDA